MRKVKECEQPAATVDEEKALSLRQQLKDWAYALRNWAQYRAALKTSEKWRSRFRVWVIELGYADKHSLEAACIIAKRCTKAEASLREVAEARARAVANAGTPGLSAGQVERLAWLTEQCGAVAHAIGKTQRYGYDSGSPFGGPTNRVMLERELGELLAALQLMQHRGDVRGGDMKHYQQSKAASVSKWMLHQ